MAGLAVHHVDVKLQWLLGLLDMQRIGWAQLGKMPGVNLGHDHPHVQGLLVAGSHSVSIQDLQKGYGLSLRTIGQDTPKDTWQCARELGQTAPL